MTIEEAVNMVDRLKPNHYDRQTKVQWLSKLDGMVFREIIQTHVLHHHHDDDHLHHFDGYDAVDPDTELLIPFPYDEDVYNYFLQSQIDKENGEIAKYNQSVTMYNAAYQRYQDWYNRTHMPLPLRSEFKF